MILPRGEFSLFIYAYSAHIQINGILVIEPTECEGIINLSRFPFGINGTYYKTTFSPGIHGRLQLGLATLRMNDKRCVTLQSIRTLGGQCAVVVTHEGTLHLNVDVYFRDAPHSNALQCVDLLPSMQLTNLDYSQIVINLNGTMGLHRTLTGFYYRRHITPDKHLNQVCRYNTYTFRITVAMEYIGDMCSMYEFTSAAIGSLLYDFNLCGKISAYAEGKYTVILIGHKIHKPMGQFLELTNTILFILMRYNQCNVCNVYDDKYLDKVMLSEMRHIAEEYIISVYILNTTSLHIRTSDKTEINIEKQYNNCTINLTYSFVQITYWRVRQRQVDICRHKGLFTVRCINVALSQGT